MTKQFVEREDPTTTRPIGRVKAIVVEDRHCYWCRKPAEADHPTHRIPWCGDCEPPLVTCDGCDISEVDSIIDGRGDNLVPMTLHLSNEYGYMVLCPSCLEDAP